MGLYRKLKGFWVRLAGGQERRARKVLLVEWWRIVGQQRAHAKGLKRDSERFPNQMIGQERLGIKKAPLKLASIGRYDGQSCACTETAQGSKGDFSLAIET